MPGQSPEPGRKPVESAVGEHADNKRYYDEAQVRLRSSQGAGVAPSEVDHNPRQGQERRCSPKMPRVFRVPSGCEADCRSRRGQAKKDQHCRRDTTEHPNKTREESKPNPEPLGAHAGALFSHE